MTAPALTALLQKPSRLCDLDRRPSEGHVAWLVGHAWPKGGEDPITGQLCFHATTEASAREAACTASPGCDITGCERAPHLDGVFWGHRT